MASTFREQTLMVRNNAVRILAASSVASTALGYVASSAFAVGTVLSADGGQWRRALGGSSYSTLTSDNDVNIKFDVDDKIGFLVSWFCTNQASPEGKTMSVEAGTVRDAWQQSLGSFTHVLCTADHSTGTVLQKWIMGPFEGARFAQRATSTATGVKMNQFYVQFKMSSATVSSAAQSAKAGILPFRWPSVKYDT